MLQAFWSSLPSKPGVYLLKDRSGKIIYIGKAGNLKNRVCAYFKDRGGETPRTAALISQIKKVDYLIVESEFEALLLEANLIKKYQPRYNVRLKDDKSYLYIKVTTADDFPKVLTCRREDQKEATYFGPFPSAKTVRTTLKTLRRIFPYCNCNFKICQKKKSCFYTEIGLDTGPCLGVIDKKSYRKIIHHLIMLLCGKTENLLKELQKEMTKAAQKEEFEKAQFFKKQIEGIKYLTRPFTKPSEYLEEPEIWREKLQNGLAELKGVLNLKKNPSRIECYDISDIQGQEATGSLVVFKRGEADKSQYRRFKVRVEGRPNDVAMMKEIIKRRFRHPEWPWPDLIVVDGGKGQVSGVIEILDEAGWQIPVIGLAKRLEEIIIPQKLKPKQILRFENLRLPHESPALHLVQRIRDEAHRFALTYHRKLRIKGLALT